jgi:hypothetical protein
MAKSLSRRIATLINKGLGNQEIITRLKCKPQQVYNTRYYMKNKEKPADKPKRKYVRKTTTPIATPIAAEVRTPLITRNYEPTLWERIKYWLS